MTDFYVGQKVVCIGWDPSKLSRSTAWRAISGPVKVGDEVVIRDIDLRALPVIGCAVLRFEGLFGGIEYNSVGAWDTMAYPSIFFRPLIEKKQSTETGMEILRKVAADAAQRKNLVKLDQV